MKKDLEFHKEKSELFTNIVVTIIMSITWLVTAVTIYINFIK